MFAYPWDLTDRQPDSIMAELAGLGVDRLALAVVYHSAQTIAPRRRQAVHTEIDTAVAHVPFGRNSFADLCPEAGPLASRDPGLLWRLATAAGEHGVRLTAWAVALHNSFLARSRPEAALRNAFGDSSTHGLCPANPDVRRYVHDLAAAAAALGCFDEILMENVAYLLAGHGHPHELHGVRLDPTTNLLLSLCFCDSCLTEGAARDIDGPGLRAWVATELARTWNGPLALSRRADEGAELSGLLVAQPDLLGWVQMRRSVVTSLLAEVTARTKGPAVTTTGAIWSRPAALSWLEGVDLGALARATAGITITPYYQALADVTRDLDHVLAFAPAESIRMAQTLWPRHHGGLDGLLAKIDAAIYSGIGRIALYNYGLAPAAALTWAREVANLIARERR